jgi:hypothetical protein
MPRPNRGPRLDLVRKKGWTRSIWYIKWTERGKKFERATPYDAAHTGEAREFFENWLNERRRAARTGPSDPDQVRVADVLDDYAREHGGEVSSPATLALAMEPLRAFFSDDTMATLTTERVKEYWQWRHKHSIRAVNRQRTEVEIVVIRDIQIPLPPALTKMFMKGSRCGQP